jgi:hypothetical protein
MIGRHPLVVCRPSWFRPAVWFDIPSGFLVTGLVVDALVLFLVMGLAVDRRLPVLVRAEVGLVGADRGQDLQQRFRRRRQQSGLVRDDDQIPVFGDPVQRLDLGGRQDGHEAG